MITTTRAPSTADDSTLDRVLFFIFGVTFGILLSVLTLLLYVVIQVCCCKKKSEKEDDDEKPAGLKKKSKNGKRSNPGSKKNTADEIMKAKHKKYRADKKKADKAAQDLSKFKKMGTIHIPKEATDATFLQSCKSPDNVVLEKAYFDEKLNEQYDIGTDVDDIELDDDSTGGTSIGTSTLDLSRKSKSEGKEKKK